MSGRAALPLVCSTATSIAGLRPTRRRPADAGPRADPEDRRVAGDGGVDVQGDQGAQPGHLRSGRDGVAELGQARPPVQQADGDAVPGAEPGLQPVFRLLAAHQLGDQGIAAQRDPGDLRLPGELRQPGVTR